MRTSFLLFLLAIGVVAIAIIMPAAKPTEKFGELLEGLGYLSLDVLDALLRGLGDLFEGFDEYWPAEAEHVNRRADGEIMYGAARPISNIYHPEILGLGEWAVADHFAKWRAIFNGGLKFVRVVGGMEQTVAGTNYFLCIQAINSYGISGHYKVRVFDQPWTNTRKLVSFRPDN